jgi:hypothetical protein
MQVAFFNFTRLSWGKKLQYKVSIVRGNLKMNGADSTVNAKISGIKYLMLFILKSTGVTKLDDCEEKFLCGDFFFKEYSEFLLENSVIMIEGENGLEAEGKIAPGKLLLNFCI